MPHTIKVRALVDILSLECARFWAGLISDAILFVEGSRGVRAPVGDQPTFCGDHAIKLAPLQGTGRGARGKA